jgi:hypothetical protein
MNLIDNERLSWRLAELARVTGLSLPFLRKEVQRKNLPTQKLGGATIVLHTDALKYLGYDQPKCSSKN